MFRRHPYITATAICAAFLGVNFLSGAFTSEQVPTGYTSHLELIGRVLMFSFMTPYLFLGTVLGDRYSSKLALTLDKTLAASLEQRSSIALIAGVLLGALNGFLFNLAPLQVVRALDLVVIDVVVVLCNILTWAVVGYALANRFSIAWEFHQFGRRAKIDLFNIAQLKPFARNGLADVLLISGAIALTVLQALDATFRLDNFSNALVVAVPTIIVLFFLPNYGIHRRIAQVKTAQLNTIQNFINEASRSLEAQEMNHLEVLLQRRERLNDAPTWPIDMSMLYRLFFYGVIPPLAWVAAALVEIYLESTLVG